MPDRSRIRPIATLAVLLLLLGGAGAAAQDATPTAGVQQGEPANLDCAALTTETPPASVLQVVSEKSEATYTVDEELTTVGKTQAIGKTNAVAGQILLDADGNPMPCSQWIVDVRTLQTDSGRRDNYVYNNTLQSETYPAATFILTSVEGLEAPLGKEEQVVRLVGDLELHGVKKPVTWDATVSMDGTTLTGSSRTTVLMADFGIEKPSVPILASVADTILLEISITAEPPK